MKWIVETGISTDSLTEMLEDFLRKRKDRILRRWFDLILEGFPQDSHKFLKLEKDRFNNPVGHTLRQETANLLEALIGEVKPEDLAKSLDNIIRIRAVQDCTPSEAIGFVFLLKDSIREELLDKPETEVTDDSKEAPVIDLR